MPTPRKPKDQHLKRGPKSSYKPDYIQMLIEHGIEGRPFETFGCKVGVTTTTLNEWCDAFPEFAVAKNMSRQFALDWWLEKGRNNVIINPDERFNATIWIFTLKAMFQLRDGSESKAQLENPHGLAKESEQVQKLTKEIEELRSALDVRKLKLVNHAG